MSHIKLKLSFAMVCTLIISACGGSHNGARQIEKKQFTNINSDKQTPYDIELQRPDFSVTPKVKEKAVNSAAELANRIQHIRLDLKDDNDVELRIKFSAKGQASDFAQFSEKIKSFKNSTAGFHGFSKDNKYEVTALCTNEYCEQTSIVLTDVETKKSVSIQYIRRNEFLKSEYLKDLNVSDEDKALINDAAEYHLPITRHSAKVEGRTLGSDVVDLLIIERPPVDEVSEDFSTEYTEVQEEEVQTPNDNHTMELESSPEGTIVKSEPPTTKPTKEKAKPEKPLKEKNKPKQKAVSQLAFTPNPYDVYKINIPAEKLKNLTVRNPLQMVNFEIVPADQQKTYEPSYRMALLANAFVEQKVKIYKNACNLFVRAVMTLAGYTGGGVYNANDFGLTFKTKAQNLDQWKKNAFVYSGNSPEIKYKTGTLQNILQNLPDSHATIAQIVRPNSPHGHVGIVAKINGVTYMFDSSYNQRGPRRTEVKASSLLNKSRKNLNIYGIQGLILIPQSI